MKDEICTRKGERDILKVCARERSAPPGHEADVKEIQAWAGQPGIHLS